MWGKGGVVHGVGRCGAREGSCTVWADVGQGMGRARCEPSPSTSRPMPEYAPWAWSSSCRFECAATALLSCNTELCGPSHASWACHETSAPPPETTARNALLCLRCSVAANMDAQAFLRPGHGCVSLEHMLSLG
eukprot:160273-Chlamydomonas_euryale.AAC.1